MPIPSPPQPERKPTSAASESPLLRAAQETKRPTDSTPMATGTFATLPMRFGRYQVEKLLGRGAMGAVYLARDTQLERPVALKIPRVSGSGSAKFLKRLRTEAKAAARIDHPNVCHVHDAGEIDGISFIAMQYVEGETLKEALQKQIRTQQEALDLVLHLAEGLAEAHAQGIFHRDLKPENIKINRRGVPVIMDFGLAKVTATLSTDASATQHGSILGSPAYMSPEQASGRLDDIDQRSDLYSLGVILYEMLTGQWPFSGAAIQVMGQKSVLEPASPLTVKTDLNPQLAAVCDKMIAKDRQNRYQSAHEVIAALQEIDLGMPGGSSPAAAPVEPSSTDAVEFPNFLADEESLASRRRPLAKHRATSRAANRSGGPRQSVALWWNHLSAGGKCTSATAGVVLLAGLVLLASGVVTRVKTKDGILAIEVNEPGADVFVDGDKVEVTWADGNRKAAIGVKPGERQVEIRKDGFAVAGKKIMFKDGLREIFKATLDPVEHGHRSNEDEKRRDQGTSRLEIAERGQDFPELPAGAYPRDVNASRKFTVTPSGLAYRILRKSDGRKPAAGDHVLADYKGWLSDGKQFDNSYQRGKPTELHLDKVIAGWKEGLQLVGVGGMIELVIPPDLGYEDRDIPEIPANSTLHFIVELREIKDPGASTAAKAESIIPFFNGKDLTGWNGLPGYWQVRDGAIVGAPANGVSAHTFLCSQKTYRDFELKFQVRRKNGVGNSGVQFRSTLKDPQKFTVVGPQLEIDSAEFRMPPGTALNEPDAKPAYEASRTVVSRLWKNNEFNEMHLLCVARHVTVRMSGVIVLDVDYPTMPDEGIIAWQLNGFRSPDEVTFKDIQFADLTRGDLRLAAGLAPAANEENEFKPLFNGKNLSGWKTHRSQPGKWAVKQGVLVGSGPGISHLYSQRQNFSDFHLRVEARINDGGNSGVWFRSSAGPEWPQDKPNWPLGFEAQINCSSKDRFKTGSLLYIPGKPLVDFPTSPVSPGQWFTLEVIAKGNHITVQVDGKTTADFTDDAQRSAKGGIALQDLGPGTVVEYRKVEIREIKR